MGLREYSELGSSSAANLLASCFKPNPNDSRGGRKKQNKNGFFFFYKLRYVIVIVNIFMAVNLMDTVHKIRAGYLPYEFMIDISKN